MGHSTWSLHTNGGRIPAPKFKGSVKIVPLLVLCCLFLLLVGTVQNGRGGDPRTKLLSPICHASCDLAQLLGKSGSWSCMYLSSTHQHRHKPTCIFLFCVVCMIWLIMYVWSQFWWPAGLGRFNNSPSNFQLNYHSAGRQMWQSWGQSPNSKVQNVWTLDHASHVLQSCCRVLLHKFHHCTLINIRLVLNKGIPEDSSGDPK
jgi:hypothetical protein